MNRADCPHCEEYRNAGYMYCGKCGKLLDCFSCNSYRYGNAGHCGSCGRPFHVTAPPQIKSFSFTRIFGIIAAILTSLFLIVDAVALYVHASDIFLFLSDKMYGMLILIPYPYTFTVISETLLQLYWLFLVAVLTLCFIKLIHETYLYFKNRKQRNEESLKIEKTGIYWIGLLWPATMFLQIAVLYAAILLFGVDFTVPDMDMDQLSLMFVLADASVWEELITRVLIIGVPLLLMALAKGKTDFWKYPLGGFGVDKLSMGLIVIAALVFGYGHEAGWGMAKVIPAFIFGLAAGYLFVEYGLYAAILLHFVNDYVSAYTWLGGSEVVLGIGTLAILAVGVLATVVLAVKMWGFLKDFKNRPPYPKGLE